MLLLPSQLLTFTNQTLRFLASLLHAHTHTHNTLSAHQWKDKIPTLSFHRQVYRGCTCSIRIRSRSSLSLSIRSRSSFCLSTSSLCRSLIRFSLSSCSRIIRMRSLSRRSRSANSRRLDITKNSITKCCLSTLLFYLRMKRKACLPAQFHSPVNAFHPDHAITHPLFLHLLKWQELFVDTFVKHGAAFLHLQVRYKKTGQTKILVYMALLI